MHTPRLVTRHARATHSASRTKSVAETKPRTFAFRQTPVLYPHPPPPSLGDAQPVPRLGEHLLRNHVHRRGSSSGSGRLRQMDHQPVPPPPARPRHPLREAHGNPVAERLSLREPCLGAIRPRPRPELALLGQRTGKTWVRSTGLTRWPTVRAVRARRPMRPLSASKHKIEDGVSREDRHGDNPAGERGFGLEDRCNQSRLCRI